MNLVDYEVTAEDIVAQNLFHSTHSRALRVKYAETIAFVLPLIFAASYAITRDGRTTLIGGGLLTLFWFACYPLAYRSAVKRHVREMLREASRGGFLGRHRIKILPRGILERTDEGTLFWPWKVVDRVQWDDDHVYIFGSSFVSHAVPRRAFPDWESYRRFEQHVRGSIERAHAEDLARLRERERRRFGRAVST